MGKGASTCLGDLHRVKGICTGLGDLHRVRGAKVRELPQGCETCTGLRGLQRVGGGGGDLHRVWELGQS